MGYPHCESADTTERRERTTLGYRRFRCRACKREFNERTGTSFNHLQYPTDIVCLVVLWRVRYKLGLRDLPEMFLERGIVFTHEAVREWEAQLARVLSEMLRKHRRGRIGPSWYADETSIKVKGRLAYLYRAIDHVVISSMSYSARSAPRQWQKPSFARRKMSPGVSRSGSPRMAATPIRERSRRTRRGSTSPDEPHLNNHLEQDHRGRTHAATGRL
jgi:putative transposase